MTRVKCQLALRYLTEALCVRFNFLQPRIKFQGHFAPQAVNSCPSVGGPLMFLPISHVCDDDIGDRTRWHWWVKREWTGAGAWSRTERSGDKCSTRLTRAWWSLKKKPQKKFKCSERPSAGQRTFTPPPCLTCRRTVCHRPVRALTEVLSALLGFKLQQLHLFLLLKWKVEGFLDASAAIWDVLTVECTGFPRLSSRS